MECRRERHENPLFYDTDKTMMLFADAKQGLQEVVEAVKSSTSTLY